MVNGRGTSADGEREDVVGAVSHQAVGTRAHLGGGQPQLVVGGDPHEVSPDESVILDDDAGVAVGGDPPDGEQVGVGEVQVAVGVDGGATGGGGQGDGRGVVAEGGGQGGVGQGGVDERGLDLPETAVAGLVVEVLAIGGDLNLVETDGQGGAGGAVAGHERVVVHHG